jgi:hypothetical protein
VASGSGMQWPVASGWWPEHMQWPAAVAVHSCVHGLVALTVPRAPSSVWCEADSVVQRTCHHRYGQHQAHDVEQKAGTPTEHRAGLQYWSSSAPAAATAHHKKKKIVKLDPHCAHYFEIHRCMHMQIEFENAPRGSMIA